MVKTASSKPAIPEASLYTPKSCVAETVMTSCAVVPVKETSALLSARKSASLPMVEPEISKSQVPSITSSDTSPNFREPVSVAPLPIVIAPRSFALPFAPRTTAPSLAVRFFTFELPLSTRFPVTVMFSASEESFMTSLPDIIYTIIFLIKNRQRPNVFIVVGIIAMFFFVLDVVGAILLNVGYKKLAKARAEAEVQAV